MTRDLRRRVLRPAAGPGDPLPGDDRPDAVHFAVFDRHSRLLSTCFVFADPYPGGPDGPAWHLRQMATEPDARGLGAGAAVLRAVAEYVADQGGGRLWCNARVPAIGFYAAQGLQTEGDVFPSGDPPIPHRRMFMVVPERGRLAPDTDLG